MPKRKFRYESLLKILVNHGYVESYEETFDLLVIKLRHHYLKRSINPTQSIQEILPVARVRRKNSLEARDLAKAQRLQGQS
jgi:ribosomal protein S8